MGLEDFDPLDAPAAVVSAPERPTAPARTPRLVDSTPLTSSPDRRRYRQPRQEARPQAAPIGREAPWSEEAEQHVIACGLLDQSDTIKRAKEEGVTPDGSFYSAANRLIWEVMVKVHDRDGLVTLEMLAEELRTARLLDAVGGFPYLMQITGKIPTTAHAGYFIAKVREKERLRKFIKAATGIVENCYSFTGGMDEFAANIEAQWANLLHETTRENLPEAKAITDFAYPANDDPNILLGSDDYLGRGGGMLIVSHGGAGKSSLAIDMAMTVGLGEPFMGIRSNGKLRVLIVQWEDSERYTGKVAQSFIHARQLNKEQVATVRENVKCVRLKGITGEKFFSALAKLVDEHLPDLVIINPIYLYAEGDISKPEVVQPFLVGLDTVNKDERFGYILIHHTGKPSNNAGKGGKKVEKQDWETVYMGFGSSYFANWPRCSMLLEPRDNAPGRFNLRLGKAGMNAGVMRAIKTPAEQTVYEPTTKIPLRYSSDTLEVNGKRRPCIYWEFDAEADESDADESKQTGDSSKRKRAAGGGKFNPSEVIALFPVGVANAEPLTRIIKKAQDVLGMKKTTFMDYRLELVNTGQVQKDDMGSYYRVDGPL